MTIMHWLTQSRTPQCLTLLSLMITLSACGGNASTSSTNESPTPTLDRLQLVNADPAGATLEAFFKERLKQLNTLYDSHENGLKNYAPTSHDESATSPTTSDNTRYSTTNIQINGVDEADLVKSDGQYLYSANQHPGLSDNPDIRILKLENTPPSATEINQITLEKSPSSVTHFHGLYLHNQQLSAITTNDWIRTTWTAGYEAPPFLSVFTYNTTDPSNVLRQQKISIEGNLVNSRRIGNNLILVTRQHPRIPNYDWYPTTEEAINQNTQIIENLSLNELLPKIQLNEGQFEPLVTPDQCRIPNTPSNDTVNGYRFRPNIVTVTRLSLDDMNNRESICLATNTNNLFVSQNALYLFRSLHLENGVHTLIHKIALRDTENSYRGSGIVPGGLSSSNPEYRFGEKDGALIVVTNKISVSDLAAPTIGLMTTTSKNAISEPAEHQLNVLKENPNAEGLAIIATLPNESYPTPIGKPGERIYGVRILTDRAYIVTFKKVDPLYVINIENPEHPKIEGELEIPGYTDYLHPINDRLLLGIGKDAEAPTENSSFSLFQGLKIALFDVANPTEPLQIDSLSIGARGTHSDALYDPKAFSALKISDDLFRFTLPIEYFAPNPDSDSLWSWGNWEYSGLALFDVTSNPSTASHTLLNSGKIVTETPENRQYQNFYSPTAKRSIIFPEHVHYVSGQQVWSANWLMPESAVGPQ